MQTISELKTQLPGQQPQILELRLLPHRNGGPGLEIVLDQEVSEEDVYTIAEKLKRLILVKTGRVHQVTDVSVVYRTQYALHLHRGIGLIEEPDYLISECTQPDARNIVFVYRKRHYRFSRRFVSDLLNYLKS